MCNIWYIVNYVFICFFYFWSNNVWIKPYVTLCCQWQPTNKSTAHCRSPLQHLSSNSVLRLIPLRVGKNIIGLHWNTKIRQLAWSQCSNHSLKGDQNLLVGNLHRDRSLGGMREVCCVSRVASTLESWSPPRKHPGGPHYQLTHPPRIQVLRITLGLSSPLSFYCAIILQCTAKFYFVGFSEESSRSFRIYFDCGNSLIISPKYC